MAGGRQAAGVAGLVAALWSTVPLAVAQTDSAEQTPPADWASGNRAQLSLDVRIWPALGTPLGVVGGALGFAHVFEPRWLIGVDAGINFGDTTFGLRRDYFVGVDATAFVRHLPNELVLVDVGIAYQSFVDEDDVSCGHAEDLANCGDFLGLSTSVGIGYRHVFVATRLRLGAAFYDDGNMFAGAVLTPLVLRFVACF